MSTHQIAVFLGPSCPLDEARTHLAGADYFPPAARGSFYDIINDGYQIIVLIDGFFYGKLSVWHKEMLYALDSGIVVIGASSMGALRAAELQGTGIIGAGTIFGWYRDGLIDGDDEVALLHESTQDNYTGLTIPLVNLRWQLMRAVEDGLIDSRSEALIIDRAKQMCFTERTLEGILEPLRDVIDIGAVKTTLSNGADLKKSDAILALKLAAEHGSSAGAPSPLRLREYEYVHMNLGIEYYTSERLTSIKAKGSAGAIPLAEYLGRIEVDQIGYRDLVRARVYQRLIVGWARELHLDVGNEDDIGLGASPWNVQVLDLEHRRATGLTLIDIARESRDAEFSRRIQQRFCRAAGARQVIADIDKRLAAQAQDAPIPWRRMVDLTGELVYTMCCLGLEKSIGPAPQEVQPCGARWEDDAILTDAERIMAYAEWIYQVGPRLFGYVLDPAREVLLAHQYLNCLDRLDRRAS
ncbi:TfuA-like protein [Mycetohabitans sp. B46]|uniref:TfuA-like protein n=1 Tax=Mycetohabitans sp. B46 TaxID=2772536 RepID=UPI00307EE46A